MKFWLAIIALGLLSGCARFEPRPLAPADTAARLEERGLASPALRSFLEQNLRRDLAAWPSESWDFEMLTLAALYYHPSLDVARAQWAVARGGETTAAQRPNPTLNVTPGYNTTTFASSPWFPLTMLDMTFETAGKRGYRRARSAQLSEAARLNIATVAWQVRSNLRASLLDFLAAGKREELLARQLALQEQIVTRLDQQAQAGAIAASESALVRIALVKGKLDLAGAQSQRVEARARVAEAIGVPLRALDEVKLAFDWPKEPRAADDLTSMEVRRTALQSRADILGALAEYAAAQAALQLEIAKQYPDIHLQPGYQFDQGDNKWSLGLTVELPVFNQNQGPIAEAKARRTESAARFNALQSKVLAEIERAVEVFRLSASNSLALRALADAQTKRRESVAAQAAAGATDSLELANVRVETAAVEAVRLEAQIRLQQAFGALEDAVQRPLDLPESVFQSALTRQPEAK